MLVKVDAPSLGVSISRADAVEPPSYDERKEASAKQRKTSKHRNARNCRYGRTQATGKCYHPKEGQFYRDPKSGDVEIKPITKINLPWD